MMKNQEEFLAELTALSQKYNITIGACGCCDSPWLSEGDEKYPTAPDGKYTVDNDGNNLSYM